MPSPPGCATSWRQPEADVMGDAVLDMSKDRNLVEGVTHIAFRIVP